MPTANTGKLSTLAGTPTNIITDKVDSPHAGLFMGLHNMTQGNYALKDAATLGFAHTFTDSSGTIQVALSAGKVFVNGEYIAVDALSATPLSKPASGALYHWAVASKDGADDGTGTASILLGTVDGVVPELTASKVPISLIRVQSTDTHSTPPSVQYFTTSKTDNEVSIGYLNSDAYTEKGALSASASGLTIEGTTATIVTTPFMSLGNGATNAGALRLLEDTDNGAHYTGFQAPAAITANSVYTLPADYPASNKVLQSTDAGILSWVTAGGGTITALNNATANELVTVGATTTELDAEANLTFSGTQLDLAGNAVITQGASGGQIAFKIDNNDTDKVAMNIDAANINADILDIGADAVTTAKVIDVTADGLTTGRILNLISDSSDTSGRRLVNIHNDNTAATGAIPLYIVNDSTGDELVIENTDASGDAEPTIKLFRNSASPVAGDYLGAILFTGEDDGGASSTYANIGSRIDNPAAGAEAGAIYLQATHQGNIRTFLYCEGHTTGTGVATVNYNSQDINLRVYGSSDTELLVTDASTNRVGISTMTPDSLLEIEQGSTGGMTAFKIDNDDTDQIAMAIEAANIDANVIDITADAVTTADVISITSDALTTGTVLNIVSDSSDTSSRNLVNIRNDNTAATNTVCLNIVQDTESEPAVVIAKQNGSLGAHIKLHDTSTDANGGPILEFHRDSSSPAPSDLLGVIEFYGEDDGDNRHKYGFMAVAISDEDDGDESASMDFALSSDTTGTTAIGTKLRLAGSASGGFDYARFIGTTQVGIGNGGIPSNRLHIGHTGADGDNGIMVVRADTSTTDGDLLGGIGFDSTDGNVPSSILEASAFIASLATEDHGAGDKGGNLKFGVSLIDENEDNVSTIVANVGQPDTTANATATYAGFNSRATTVIVEAATYAPTVQDSGILIIFAHANSNLTLPSINNTTTVGVQFTVFNFTGSTISAQIAVSDSATINGAAATGADDIESYKAATFVAVNNNMWARVG